MLMICTRVDANTVDQAGETVSNLTVFIGASGEDGILRMWFANRGECAFGRFTHGSLR
jgi:hypothetical protein